MLAMIRAFAPILASNGGGAVVNMRSVVCWFVPPFNATYAASKHAALAVSEAARIQLKSQNTQVVGVYAGFIDTAMAAGINQPKTLPKQVAERTLEGIVSGKDHVLADNRAEEIWQATRSDPEGGRAATMPGLGSTKLVGGRISDSTLVEQRQHWSIFAIALETKQVLA
jgi:short-subunit dehydrogenase